MPQVSINFPQSNNTFNQTMNAVGNVTPGDAAMSATLKDSNGNSFDGAVTMAAFPFNWAFKFSNVPASSGPPNPNLYTLTVTANDGRSMGSAQATNLSVQ